MKSAEYPKCICPICRSMRIKEFIEINQIPVYCNLLWHTREAAIRAPKGDIRLGYCQDCSHIFNLAFNPTLMDYTQQYENSLHFSPRFQEYATSLAKALINRYDLYNKNIIEIGSGRGDFLKLICKLGDNQGVGFDPSFPRDQIGDQTNNQVTFINDYYSEKYADYRADFLCSRHTLEHIYDPRSFISMLKRILRPSPKTVVFFEVPNMAFTLDKLAIWDIIYEHYSYYCPHSLFHLFREFGFDILNIDEKYDGQFLSIEAVCGNGKVGNTLRDNRLADLDLIASQVSVFSDRYQQKIHEWQELLTLIEISGKRAVIWGAGSKGVSFLNFLGISNSINYVIDINPRKQGLHTAGTGQKITSPNFLREYLPEVIIVMNAIYLGEIKQMTNEYVIAAEFILA